jgi:hypothetical protein
MKNGRKHPQEQTLSACPGMSVDLHKRAGSGARPFEGANISTSEKHAGPMYEFMRERWSRSRQSSNSFFGSRQPGGHGWIRRISQRFLPLQPRIEIKIDRIIQKNGDISKKQLDFLLLLLWAAFV